MVTGAFETLRSAGRPLELELPGDAELPARVEELRDAARCLLDEGPDDTRSARPRAARRARRSGTLLDLSGYAVKAARGSGTRPTKRRAAVEQAALDELARRDRDLLQDLLQAFAKAYRAAKDNDSALDFEDLQLLRARPARERRGIRDRERWRFRAIMVDEFQDTNRLQCEFVDLLAAAGEGAVLRRRRVPVDLPLPPRRRRGLPRARAQTRRACCR